jgi:hypothetical protein
MGSPILIENSNLSLAWGTAFLELMRRPLGQCPQLIVSMAGFDSNLPPEADVIRAALDNALASCPKCVSCAMSAMTIFPYKLWIRRRNLSCEDFCNICTTNLLPRLQALDRRNLHGTYFARMMAYPSIERGQAKTINQLAEVVDRLSGSKHFRATGLQMTCFHPALDHSRQPRLGFPCLQHVGITYEDDDGIAITGFYPSQHIFDRAYGNYLGLAHLGRFICDQTGLELRRITCIATRPMLGSTAKSAVQALEAIVSNQLGAN